VSALAGAARGEKCREISALKSLLQNKMRQGIYLLQQISLNFFSFAPLAGRKACLSRQTVKKAHLGVP
jgi:hypothetical protein